MFLIIDTETTGTPRNYRAPIEDVDNWPRIVQLAWLMFDDSGAELVASSRIIEPEGWTIPDEAAGVHGITTAKAQECGERIGSVLESLRLAIQGCRVLVAHNIEFDLPITAAEFWRLDKTNPLSPLTRVCTMKRGVDVCKLPGKYGYKWPRLEELHRHLFESVPEKQHDALADVRSCARCFFEMRKRGHIEIPAAEAAC